MPRIHRALAALFAASLLATPALAQDDGAETSETEVDDDDDDVVDELPGDPELDADREPDLSPETIPGPEPDPGLSRTDTPGHDDEDDGDEGGDEVVDRENVDDDNPDMLKKLPPSKKDISMGRIMNDGLVPIEPGGGRLMDTRLSFSFSDDDWLSGPGETTPSSPGVDFAPRTNNQLFFDNLNRRDTGFETLTHLVIHRRQAGFIAGMDTEAAIVARFRFFSDELTGTQSQSFADDGSYLRMRYFFNGSIEDTTAPNIDLVMFPFNSNRFRLGYLWDISWGGNDIFAARGRAAPAAKLQVNAWDGYFFAGAKTARILDENINEPEANWGALTGAGWDFFDVLAVDVSGGFFQRGTNPNAAVLGEPVLGYGGSGRVTLHLGAPVPRGVDFRLYRDDQQTAQAFSTATRGSEGLGFVAAWEYTHLQHTLEDPDQTNTTTIQPANATALSLGFTWNNFNATAVGLYRDLAFIQFNVPGLNPFTDFPDGSTITPEFQTGLTVAYLFEDLHLTPRFGFGLFLPATVAGFNVDFGDGPPADYSPAQVVVVRAAGSRDILPCAVYDEDSGQCTEAQGLEPIYALRSSLKWDASRMLSFVADVSFLIDNNQTRIIDTGGGIATRVREGNLDVPNFLFPGTTAPHRARLAAGIYAQARF